MENKLEEVRKLYKIANQDQKYVLESLFPELRDSEDERIRKWLIDTIKAVPNDSIEWEEINKSDVLDWLERQGEKKPAKSRFKVGDWVIDIQGFAHQIANVEKIVANNTYGYNIVGGGYFNDKTESVRLWTIEDAKPGDVLVTNNGRPFIFKGLLDKFHPKSPVAYCGIDVDDEFCVPNGISWWTDEEVKPASKDERELLSQKMKEAGYDFDFGKKKLVKIDKINS